jgi:hypothetical protein
MKAVGRAGQVNSNLVPRIGQLTEYGLTGNVFWQVIKELMCFAEFWVFHIGDLLTVIALVAGPIIAVRVVERLRISAEHQSRRMHLFRTLMSTRSLNLDAGHIQAINLVDVEFLTEKKADKQVITKWQIYRQHLDSDVSPDWEKERQKLFIDLLQAVAVAVGYEYDEALLIKGVYFPHAYQAANEISSATAKAWHEVLNGERKLKFEVYRPHESQGGETGIQPK